MEKILIRRVKNRKLLWLKRVLKGPYRLILQRVTHPKVHGKQAFAQFHLSNIQESKFSAI